MDQTHLTGKEQHTKSVRVSQSVESLADVFFTSSRVGWRSIVMTVSVCACVCLCVCVCVCLTAAISLELHVQYSPNFLCMRQHAWSWLSPPLAVLWMTLYLLIMGHMQGCQCNTGTASHGPWLMQQAISP